MAEIRFRKNGTIYHLDFRGIDAPCEQRLAFRYSGNTYYVPAMSTQGTKVFGGTFNGSSWYYDTSSPTIAFRKNGKTYYCSKSLTTERYDIPAGTYVGQGAYDLFKKFISNNSYRTLKDSVTIRHMNITRTFPVNTRVWLIYGYGGDCINLCFQTGPDPKTGVDIGYNTNTNGYWDSSSTNPCIQLHIYNGGARWSSNNFTITGGIKFN